MKYSRRATIFVLLLTVSFTTTITLITCTRETYNNNNTLCIDTERQSLLAFKISLQDPSDLLLSWNDSSRHCCAWEYVVCDALTGHVREIDLQSQDPLSRLRGGITSPPLLLDLKHLARLDLSGNDFDGSEIPSFIGSLESLEYLNLSHSGFRGNIPCNFGNLLNLKELYLDDNMLEGIVTENHFSNLSMLDRMSASGNSLALRVSKDWIPPFQLQYLNLDSWNLGPRFPPWLQTQRSLITMKLSNTRISGEVPTWFWILPSLNSLDLSHNQLSGEIPHLFTKPLSTASALNRSWTIEPGDRPYFTTYSIVSIDLSNNSFSGGISHTLCTARNDMTFLHLGGNNLSGEIPDCWMNWPRLIAINLGNNKFYGKIPSSLGLLRHLQSLNLYNNALSGPVPSSIQNCTQLVKMDLSGNELEGNIPAWIGTSLSDLRILMLRSNNFGGKIAPHCMLHYLHVLDLAKNRFLGEIPRCLDNLTLMSSQIKQNDSELEYYFPFVGNFMDSATLTTKGSVRQYDKVLSLFNSIDLSKSTFWRYSKRTHKACRFEITESVGKSTIGINPG